MPDQADAAAERLELDCVLRDGTRLHTVLLVPAGEGPWPALLTRHPYDVTREETGARVDVHRLVAAGYLVALQDVRGRYASEGEFDPSAREADDGADAVAWLAARPECSGVVGMFGASYASETQVSALLGGAPALRSIVPAVTPVASGIDGFRFRGGVPELGSMTAWAHFPIAPDVIDRITDLAQRAEQRRRWEATDRAIASGAAFRVGALSDSPPAEATVEWMRDRLRLPLDHPDHLVGKVGDRIDALAVPVLLIGGWFDVFLGSTLELYRRLAEQAAAGGGPAPHLLVGPWSHGDMSGRLGGVDFGEAASADHLGGDDLTDRHIRWFDATLREGRDADGRPPVQVFLMGENRWVDLPAFPPPGAATVALHLAEGGALAADPGPDGERTIALDPGDPVPTRGGATLLFPPFEPGPVDQSDLERRSDVASWRTEPLAEPLTVLGGVRAVIQVSSTGTDADVVVRLCDEDPGGRSRVIADGVQRASARDLDPVTGRGTPRPLEPGAVVELTVDLWSTAHVFLPGHRIRVDIAPSSSPRWAVNPGRFAGPAEHVDPVPTRHTIRFGAGHPSRLVLTTAPS